MCVGRLLDHRVRLQEPPQLRVVDATVHVDDLHAIHVLVTGEAARRVGRGASRSTRIAIRPPVTEGRVVQRLGHRTIHIGDPHQAAKVIVDQVARGLYRTVHDRLQRHPGHIAPGGAHPVLHHHLHPAHVVGGRGAIGALVALAAVTDGPIRSNYLTCTNLCTQRMGLSVLSTPSSMLRVWTR